MKIESRSLSAYLKSQGVKWEGSELKVKWKEILMFPDEDWRIGRNSVLGQGDSESTQSNLDPAKVLARMLCVKIDRAITNNNVIEKLYIKNRRDWDKTHLPKSISKEEKRIPISWLLRIAERKNLSWDPGDVLIFAFLMGGATLHHDINEINRYFPDLLSGKSIRDEDQVTPEASDSVKKITEIFNQTYPEFLSRDLIHISAPKFHKIWTAMVDDKIREADEDTNIAKQQWSMKVNTMFEGICKNSIPEESVMLQSGGGHVLLLPPKKSENEKFSRYS